MNIPQEPMKLALSIKFTNSNKYEALIDDVRQKYEELQAAIKRLSDFQLEYNITFITGDSGTGKSAVFSFLEEMAAEQKDIKCFNYLIQLLHLMIVLFILNLIHYLIHHLINSTHIIHHSHIIVKHIITKIIHLVHIYHIIHLIIWHIKHIIIGKHSKIHL